MLWLLDILRILLLTYVHESILLEVGEVTPKGTLGKAISGSVNLACHGVFNTALEGLELLGCVKLRISMCDILAERMNIFIVVNTTSTVHERRLLILLVQIIVLLVVVLKSK